MEGQYYKFYVVRTMHFGMKLYNDQRNAQVSNLFIYKYLLLPYILEITNTMHKFPPLLYAYMLILHVSAVVCYLQGAAGSV
jgi:hypothetical protein